jgi:hypothetical protein
VDTANYTRRLSRVAPLRTAHSYGCGALEVMTKRSPGVDYRCPPIAVLAVGCRATPAIQLDASLSLSQSARCRRYLHFLQNSIDTFDEFIPVLQEVLPFFIDESHNVVDSHLINAVFNENKQIHPG